MFWVGFGVVFVVGLLAYVVVHSVRKAKRYRQAEERLERVMSPFDQETIGPGDPGWEIFEAAMKSGKPVHGIYDGRTGEIVSMKTFDDDGE